LNKRRSRKNGHLGTGGESAKRRGPRVPLLYQGGFEYADMTREDEQKYRTVLRVQNIYGAYYNTSSKSKRKNRGSSTSNSMSSKVHGRTDRSVFFRRLVAQFHHREAELIDKLEKKYGREPPMVEMNGPDGWAREPPKLLRSPALEGQKIVQVCSMDDVLALWLSLLLFFSFFFVVVSVFSSFNCLVVDIALLTFVSTLFEVIFNITSSFNVE
jgi:hypothetical protein